MVERESPLGTAYKPGRHGNVADAAGVTLSETRPGSIVEIVAWPGTEKAALAAIKSVTGLALPDKPRAGVVKSGKAGLGFAPRRWLVIDDKEGLAAELKSAIGIETGAVNDLSHGRTVIRVAGPRAEWVLSKLFAVDFSVDAFPVSNGCSTSHHEIFAQIQRTGRNQFDVIVFRSFARAFFTTLCHAAEETGYDVA
ncbi:MAG: sarcosine oxidase subunit gamma family protein [Rhizobiaceae bacterium]|jgi:sarcosine oxidase subunit gamma|nr:sarcosine oxidase subunit gamma family protein [Rhizobiaceae bacterium]